MRQLIMIVAITCCLCACGVKPGGVDSPSGTENDSFPRTYPDISTDP